MQTGNEPESGEAWYGRNLLTGYIFWKNINYEDGIVVSESAAAKLASPDPLDIGDKLSNRHGTKGTIGAILPDDEMPRMPDGTPVDLIFDMSGLHTRNNFGQIREAVLGNIAHARRQPIICPPFGSPSADEIREMLREVGLPESGQQQLADGDRPLDMPSTVGYVYWGKTFHRAADKLGAWAADPVLVSRRQRQGEMENWALRSCGAFENILENINTRSMDRAGIGRLVDEVVGGPVRQSPAPSALFQKLQQRIRTAGILASFDGHEVSFSLAKPSPEDAPLSLPVPHPWCAEIELTHVGPPGGKAAPYDRFIEANARAARSINGSAPDAIRDSARAELSDELRRLLNALDVRDDMRLGNRVMFSTRSVLATGYDLELGEVGLPEPMAWSIFSPLVAREIGNEMARERSPEAMRALRQVMADNVVLVNRAPTLTPTNITAFTPVLRDGPAIRLHPLCCRLFNADYDGDQVAVLLPITREAQAEAREKLTLEGHIRLDPGAMISHMTPCMTHLYGLAWAARSGECRADLVAAWPESLPGPPQDLTRAWLMNALSSLTEDPIAFLDALQQLMHLGVRFATQSGASLHPFVGEGLSLPAQPQHEWPGAWHAYCDSVDAAISAQTDLDSPDLGPQMTLIASGARGNMHQLRQLVGPRGPLGGSPWSGPIIRKGFRDGVPPAEYFESIRTSRGALQSLNTSMAVWGRDLKGNMLPTSDTVLALAIRARRPGEVLAKAAVDGESDPLTDPYVRLWMGLKPEDG